MTARPCGHTDALLVAAGAGNLKAFAEFYDQTAPVVWGMLRGVLGNPTQAERATEDIYLQLWHTAPEFDPASRSAWETVLFAARRALTGRVRDLVVANLVWQDGQRSAVGRADDEERAGRVVDQGLAG